MDIKEFVYEGLDWIHLVDMAMNLLGQWERWVVKTALVRGILVFCHGSKMDYCERTTLSITGRD
jgi:hypothetical protein